MDKIARAAEAVNKAEERRSKTEAAASRALMRFRDAEEALWRAQAKLRDLRGKEEE